MRRIASWILFWVVAAAFGVAGALKVADPAAFLSSILTYELFPYKLAALAALYAPWLELTLAASLATGLWRRGAAWLSALLLLLFIGLVIQARLRGLTVDCGCFGSNQLEDGVSYARKIAENTALLACLWLAVTLDSGRGAKGS